MKIFRYYARLQNEHERRYEAGTVEAESVDQATDIIQEKLAAHHGDTPIRVLRVAEDEA